MLFGGKTILNLKKKVLLLTNLKLDLMSFVLFMSYVLFYIFYNILNQFWANFLCTLWFGLNSSLLEFT